MSTAPGRQTDADGTRKALDNDDNVRRDAARAVGPTAERQ